MLQRIQNGTASLITKKMRSWQERKSVEEDKRGERRGTERVVREKIPTIPTKNTGICGSCL